MKQIRKLLCFVLVTLSVTSIASAATDYTFETDDTPEYYPSTSYEEIYGSLYNYGGPNIVDYQIPELEYGTFSTTQTGIMEKALLPGLQASVSTASGGGYGISGGAYGISESIAALPELPEVLPDFQNQQYQPPAYTSVEGMEREDGSIGTIQIPSLDISMKLWEGETNASMAKGLGHYSSTSAWDGNVGVCGHNRGAKYVIGSIKDLNIGDTITYTTVYGTRTYAVETVEIIDSTDWSYLQSTADNRVTLTTCLADQPSKRVCVQAVEVRS